MKEKSKNNYAYYITGFILSQILIWLFFLTVSSNCTSQCWNDWFSGYFENSEETKDILKNHPYCENKGIDSMNDFMLTRTNSMSNYIYVFFGSLNITIGIFCWQNRDDEEFASNHLRRNPLWLAGHGLILIYGGITSFTFHASFTTLAYLLDIASVFTMLGYPVSYSLMSIFIDELDAKLSKIISNICAIVAIIFNIMFGFWLVWINDALSKNEDFALNILVSMAFLMMAAVFVKVYIQRRLQRTQYKVKYWIMASSLISIIVAIPCQETQIKIPCEPNAVLQFHSLWHLFSGIALFLTMLFFFYEEEHPRNVENDLQFQLSDLESARALKSEVDQKANDIEENS